MFAWLTKALLIRLAPWAALGLLTVLGVSHWWAYSIGVDRERDRQEALRITMEQQAKARQEALADELEQARLDRRVVYRDRVRVVERSADPSGCADVAAPHGVLDSLGYRATGQ
jgi:hypothetical protein